MGFSEGWRRVRDLDESDSERSETFWTVSVRTNRISLDDFCLMLLCFEIKKEEEEEEKDSFGENIIIRGIHFEEIFLTPYRKSSFFITE